MTKRTLIVMAVSTSAAMLAVLDVASAEPATHVAFERAAADLPPGLGVLSVELPEAIRYSETGRARGKIIVNVD